MVEMNELSLVVFDHVTLERRCSDESLKSPEAMSKASQLHGG